MEWTEIAIGLSILIAGLYYWLTSTFDFWTSRGVVGPSPKPFFGNLFDVSLGKLSLGEYVKTIYDANRDEAMFGIFMKRDPVLVLIDPDLIKDVLIKDFSTFPHRGSKSFDKMEPFADNLFNLELSRWRPLRNKLSPVFASGKLKKMFSLLVECGEHLEEYLKKLTVDNDAVECRELTAKFTTDVISSYAFGLQTNALTDENSEFRNLGRDFFARDWKTSAKVRIRDFAPWIYSLLGPVITDRKIINFFLSIMRDTVECRKNNRIVKHDFIQLIMEIIDNPDKLGGIEVTDHLLTAQLFAFFVGGFHTSSIAMSNVLYELAQHQTIQDKLRDDINRELAKSNGEITYEGVKCMKYLDMVFQETLRKYPAATLFMRQSTEQYTFAGTKVTIPEGTIVIIPVYAIHRDPQIYPKPEVFDPERFTDEAIKARQPMSWLGFGEGPRNCIATRFAHYQSKVGLVKILQHYKVEVCDKTQIPYVLDPETSVMTPTHGIYVKMSRLD